MDCEIVVEKRRVMPEEGFLLDYTLSKRSGRGGLVLYSVLIEETLGQTSEFIFLDALTEDETKAKDVFNLLADEIVTPCTAEDVLCEILYAPW